MRQSVRRHKLSMSTMTHDDLTHAMMSKFSMLTSQTTTSVRDILGLLPVCIEPTSKTTVINDPTAGMNSDQIQNYIDNVGGGMCGYPEWIRTFLGLGLNLSLLTFGIFTVVYVILSGWNFFLEKQVEDLLKKAEAESKALTGISISNPTAGEGNVVKKFVPSSLQSVGGMEGGMEDDFSGDGVGMMEGANSKMRSGITGGIVNYKGAGLGGESRAARRLKERLRRDDKKNES